MQGPPRALQLVLSFEAGPEFFPNALLRFDGIDSAGIVWLNGVELRTTRGSRLSHELMYLESSCRAATPLPCGWPSSRRRATWRIRTRVGSPASSGT